MVPPCFEGAESICDLGLPRFEPLRGFLGFIVSLDLFIVFVRFFFFSVDHFFFIFGPRIVKKTPKVILDPCWMAYGAHLGSVGLMWAGFTFQVHVRSPGFGPSETLTGPGVAPKTATK